MRALPSKLSAARGVQVEGWARAARPGELAVPWESSGAHCGLGALSEWNAGKKPCEQGWAAESTLQWTGQCSGKTAQKVLEPEKPMSWASLLPPASRNEGRKGSFSICMGS